MATMHPQDANELNKRGGTILCLDVPPGTTFGLDCMSWTTGDRFKGVKMIPPGVHYVWCSTSPENALGFFLHFKSGQVAVRRWQSQTESLAEVDHDEERQFSEGVKRFAFDSGLAPYPFDSYKKWQSLSGHITEKVVNRLEPVGKVMHSSTQGASAELRGQKEEKASANGTDNNMEPFGASGSGLVFYSDIPRPRLAAGATPQQVTSLYMDKSSVLEDIISNQWDGDELALVGELEFAFIAFLMCQSYDGFEQWKRLLILLCSCEAALSSRPGLYTEFIGGCLCGQLNEVPEDFFTDELSSKNFLRASLKSLLESASGLDAQSELRGKLDRLSRLVRHRFGWDAQEQEEDEEDGPVVVDYSEVEAAQTGDAGSTETEGTRPQHETVPMES